MVVKRCSESGELRRERSCPRSAVAARGLSSWSLWREGEELFREVDPEMPDRSWRAFRRVTWRPLRCCGFRIPCSLNFLGEVKAGQAKFVAFDRDKTLTKSSLPLRMLCTPLGLSTKSVGAPTNTVHGCRAIPIAIFFCFSSLEPALPCATAAGRPRPTRRINQRAAE